MNYLLLRFLFAMVVIAGVVITEYLREQPNTFDLPREEVHRLIRNVQPPAVVFSMTNTSVVSTRSDQMEWVLYQGRKEAFRFVATLELVNPRQTRVTLKLVAASPEAEAKLDADWSTRHLYKVTMADEIVSAVTGVTPAAYRLYIPTTIAAVAHLGALSKSMSEVARLQNELNVNTTNDIYRRTTGQNFYGPP